MSTRLQVRPTNWPEAHDPDSSGWKCRDEPWNPTERRALAPSWSSCRVVQQVLRTQRATLVAVNAWRWSGSQAASTVRARTMRRGTDGKLADCTCTDGWSQSDRPAHLRAQRRHDRNAFSRALNSAHPPGRKPHWLGLMPATNRAKADARDDWWSEELKDSAERFGCRRVRRWRPSSCR